MFKCQTCGKAFRNQAEFLRHGENGCGLDAASREGLDAARRGGTDNFAVPIRNDAQGHLSVGSPEAAKWSLHLEAIPPTSVYIPEWIWDHNDKAKEARVVFRMLADLEFLVHQCDRCGGEHRRIVRGKDHLIDMPCC